MGRKPKCRLVAYYRVSTDKQGQSGLGLEAQQAAVSAYSVMTGCEIVATYTEVESGKRSDRPELLKAIAHAKRAGATLVIAKLDRLGRNVHFISGLIESGVDFIAADSPGDDKMMWQMKAVFAEEEARKISERTKAALAAYKARGGVLGGRRENAKFNLTQEARVKGSKISNARQAREAVEVYDDLIPTMRRWRSEGMSQRQIADRLNSEGHTTRTGAAWGQVQVKRVLDRTEGA